MTVLALVLYAGGLLLAFGVRTTLHRRRTGSSGFSGISGTPRDLGWWGGVLFVAALLLGMAAPVAALSGVVEPLDVPTPVHVLGIVLAAAGLAIVLAAQTGMGTSWRIGVDEAERTELVTGGLFAVVRNPIFTGMLLAQAGMLLLVPQWLALLALLCLLVAVEIQVRVLEEPYLLTTHASAYRAYAARTGRLVPGLGRLRAPG